MADQKMTKECLLTAAEASKLTQAAASKIRQSQRRQALWLLPCVLQGIRDHAVAGQNTCSYTQCELSMFGKDTAWVEFGTVIYLVEELRKLGYNAIRNDKGLWIEWNS